MMQREGGCLLVSGRLTMDAIGISFADAMQPLDGKDWTVDLAQVEVADSAAVSLLLAWLRNAQRYDAKLSFVNVPANLHSLADLYDVANALSLDKSTK